MNEFVAILRELEELALRKNQDYGTDGDPLANLRASEAIGIPAWKGTYLRLRDKVARLDTYCQRGTLANEGVEDSLRDLACYAILTLVLHREATAPVAEQAESRRECPKCGKPTERYANQYCTSDDCDFYLEEHR